MSSILLPSSPGLRIDRPRMMDWGGALTPQLGGAVQTLMRLGTRHSLEFTLPPVPTEPTGRIWAARLKMAKLFGALAPFGQDGFRVGAPGSIIVDGAGQTGMTLVVRGGTPNYAIREGQAFSIITATAGVSRRYLYFASGQALLDASGAGSVPIFPMLRVSPADGDLCEFGKPMIEGSLSGNEISYERMTAPWTTFPPFTITEDE